MPSVSVVMPVRNGMPYLRASIESILTQSFTDFELVILDDASSDDTWGELQRWSARDHRLKLVRSETPLGLARSSNRVVEVARSSLIARMDADDLAHTDRLRKQVDVLEASSDVVLVGCLAEGIDHRGDLVRPRGVGRVLRRSPYAPFPHGSAMFRKDAFEQVGGYRERCEGWEDVDLFLRLYAVGEVFTLIEALYMYRFHTNSATLTGTGSPGHAHAHALALLHACIASYQREGAYEECLGNGIHAPTSAGRIGAYAYQSSICIWSGSRPPAMADLEARAIPSSGWLCLLRAVVNATWGRLSPKSLRGVLATFIRLKDLVAVRRLRGREEVRWVIGP